MEAVSGVSLPDLDSRIKENVQLSENDVTKIIGKDLNKDMSKAGYLSIEKVILPQEDEAIYVYEASVSFNDSGLESWCYVINAANGKIIEKKDALRYESVTVDGKGVLGDLKTMTGYKGTIPDLYIVPE
jgi:Zn-dependent metalloprotease